MSQYAIRLLLTKCTERITYWSVPPLRCALFRCSDDNEHTLQTLAITFTWAAVGCCCCCCWLGCFRLDATETVMHFGNSVLATACHTGTRPPPADIAISGHGRSRTGVAVWIADCDPPIDPCGAKLSCYTYYRDFGNFGRVWKSPSRRQCGGTRSFEQSEKATVCPYGRDCCEAADSNEASECNATKLNLQ